VWLDHGNAVSLLGRLSRRLGRVLLNIFIIIVAMFMYTFFIGK
jgi:hypothetical protein